MPIDDFQRTLLVLLSKHRSPNSFIAGGIAINRGPSSSRFSRDVDFFHDAVESVRLSADADMRVLRENGYELDTIIAQPAFVRISARKGKQALKLEWVIDSAFRFFPVVKDPVLGFRLHDVDLATNKCLALANRIEVRDIIDLCQLHESVMSLWSICWAACGKDLGFTPELLIDSLRRNSKISPEQLAAESLAKNFNPRQLKLHWTKLLNQASEKILQFPAADLGCVYLNSNDEVMMDPEVKSLAAYKKHFGTVGGAWPRAVN